MAGAGAVGAEAVVALLAGWWRKAVGQGTGGAVTVRARRSRVSVAVVGLDGGGGRGRGITVRAQRSRVSVAAVGGDGGGGRGRGVTVRARRSQVSVAAVGGCLAVRRWRRRARRGRHGDSPAKPG